MGTPQIPSVDSDSKLFPTAVMGALAGAFGAASPGYDIFILAGQSNMSGYSEPVTALNSNTLDRQDPKIQQWGTHGTLGIKPAQEPLDMYDTPPGIGPGLQFARWYASRKLAPNRKVLLVPVAKGGTTFEGSSTPAGFTWKVDRTDVTNLYTNMVNVAKAAKAGADAIAGTTNRFTGLLWLQGETDGDNSTTAATYRTDLDALVTSVRADLSVPTMPVLIGTMVPEYLTTGTRKAIDAAHRSSPLRLPLVDVAVGATGANKGDGNHYSQAGQRLNGKSFYDAFERISEGLAPVFTDYTPAQVNGLTVSAASTSSLTAGWSPAMNAASYLVEYRVTGSAGGWASAGTTTNTSASITGLNTGTSYDVRVTASNLFGDAGAPSATATGTPANPTPPTVSDSFTRSDSATTLGTADTGQTWAAAVGTWGVSSNKGYSVTYGDGDRAVIETGVVDQTVTVTVTGVAPGSAGPNPSVLARMTDGNNGYLVAYGASTSRVSLFKIVAGTYTSLATAVTVPTLADGQKLGISVIGSTVKALVDGAAVLTATDTTFTTGTKAGLRVGSASALLRYDDFSVR